MDHFKVATNNSGIDYHLNFKNLLYNVDGISTDDLIKRYDSYFYNELKNPYDAYLICIEDIYSIGLININECRKLMSYGDSLKRYLLH